MGWTIMIHFFTKISKQIKDLEFNKELQNIGVAYRYFGCLIPFEYRSRALFLLSWYPKLIYHATVLGVKSLVFSKPRPTVVVLETDIDVLVFTLIRMFLFRKK